MTGQDQGDPVYFSKRLAIELIPGILFSVIRAASSDGPLEVLVNGFHLSLCRKQADILNIDMVNQ